MVLGMDNETHEKKNRTLMIELNIKQQLGQFSLDIHTQIPSAGICAIFGRSGSGKTSIINAISGLTTPDEGYIRIGDSVTFDSKQKINLPPQKRNIAYVFQDARLFPHMRVEKNLLYGCKNKKDPSSQALLIEIIELLDLAPLLKRYPVQLSGGEKQRVAIGRALLTQPTLILMDEPTAALDLPRKKELLSYLAKLVANMQIPVLYVSHQLDEILQLADHLLLIEKGRVLANGALDEVWNSIHLKPWFDTDTVSTLVKVRCLGTHPCYPLTKVDLSGQSLWLPLLPPSFGQVLRLRLYAKDISIAKTYPTDSSIRNILEGLVIKMAKKADNSECLLSLAIGESTLLASISCWAADALNIKLGDRVYAQLKNACISKNDLIALG